MCRFLFSSFLRVVSFHSHSHSHSYFSFGYMCVRVCVCASKLNTSSFETHKFTCTHSHTTANTHANAHTGKAYPSNKWSRTNKKERANAQQKHPIESFSSYACQMRNDTELDEHDTSTQRGMDARRRTRKLGERGKRERGSWERQEGS